MKITQNIRRKCIQFAAFGLSNLHAGNLLTGKLYTGPWKNFCNPGLHCYSCPAATAACPIGALQTVMGSVKFDFSFYVVGFLAAVGILLGRFVCGFLCPFGLVQELIHKIPLKKRRLPGWMKYIKYVILAFTLLYPVVVTHFGLGDPAFCKYICPSGTLFGAGPLLLADEALHSAVGPMFLWKSFLLVGIIFLCMLVYRFFCRVLCPLGAIYGLMNRYSFYRLRVDEDKCIHCGKCVRICPMEVDPTRTPDSPECIRCGACAQSCPVGAIRMGFGIRRKKNAPSAGCTGQCTNCKGCSRGQ